jgi:hypothetical protein
MLQMRAIRDLFRGRVGENPRDARAGRRTFLQEWYQTLGITADEQCRPTYLTEGNGHYHFGEHRCRPEEVSIRDLAEAIHGHDFVNEYYHPNSQVDFGARALQEAAIDPTAFLNISTFNLAVAGLIDAQILERFNQPTYIGRNLVKIVPTRKNGDKIIGVARQNPQSAATKGRLPGEPHAEVGFGDAYQTTPETIEQGLKASLTKEVVFYDLTGQPLEEASAVGDELSYGQEKVIADEVMGTTNTYNRNGTAFNTYQTASPWVNDQSNEFLDYQDLDDARQLFVGMTDPESGKEIQINATTLLVMPAKAVLVKSQLAGMQIMLGSQQTAGNFPGVYTIAPNPVSQMGPAFNVVELTAIWYNRATAADGLGLSAANAKKYWWLLDPSAFEWRENWPLTPWQANTDELTMKDRGLIAVYGANYRGAVYTREPRKVVRNKN